MFYEPKPLNFGDSIFIRQNQKEWGKGNWLFITGPNNWINSGLWKGLKDKYVGLRFKISGNFHYGWARFDVASNGKSITVKDFAYNSEADKSILAGVSKVSLPDEDPMKNIRVYSASGNIRIEASVNENLTGRIRLSDINGRELRSIDVKNEKTIQLNSQEFPTGLYIVNIVTEKGTLNKKVLVP